jgi:hypothetical protein
LEFIFENPIAIIFIIGAIVSFFKKMKENNNPNPNQEINPEWKKVLNIPETINDGRRMETRAPREPREDREPLQTSNQLAKEYYEVKSNTEKKQSKENTRKDSANHRKDINKTVVNHEVLTSVDLTPTKDTLTDGIVWAEILGPPRAYKAHSQRKAPYRR